MSFHGDGMSFSRKDMPFRSKRMPPSCDDMAWGSGSIPRRAEGMGFPAQRHALVVAWHVVAGKGDGGAGREHGRGLFSHCRNDRGAPEGGGPAAAGKIRSAVGYQEQRPLSVRFCFRPISARLLISSLPVSSILFPPSHFFLYQPLFGLSKRLAEPRLHGDGWRRKRIMNYERERGGEEKYEL